MNSLDTLFAQGLVSFANSLFGEMSKPENIELIVQDLLGIERPKTSEDVLIEALKAYKQGNVSKDFVNALFTAWVEENKTKPTYESTLKQIHQLLS